VLNLISCNDAERLRNFFAQAGYADDNLLQRLGFAELPSGRLRNLARLLDRTAEPSCLNTLLRWFWIGTPQDASAAGKYVPSWFTTLALGCGLLRQDGQWLIAEAMLVTFDGFLIACDHTSKMDAADSEYVLWPNPTSQLLSRFTVRRPSETTLDLGTGNGILALCAASHSHTVTATDLNPRAMRFAAFNARLNGIENVECLPGDGFAPVAGRKFDLIVSNPPFFITPRAEYLFCDNPLDLDQLCQRLVREAPDYLSEDGYFQMICEWAQVSGQPWQERVAAWLDNTGCDAWLMKGYTVEPARYAEECIRGTTSSPDRDAELYAQYMAYYREKGLEAIHGGIIAMHHRLGHNWIHIEDVSQMPKEPFGESVLQTFSARDFLQSHSSDDQLRAMKPRLSPDTCLEQVLQPGNSGWKQTSLTLRRVQGVPFSLVLQPLVAEFLGSCDGTRTLGDLIDHFAGRVNVPPAQVQEECLGVVRKLIGRGFVLF
jgi:predicted RNA methylase